MAWSMGGFEPPFLPSNTAYASNWICVGPLRYMLHIAFAISILPYTVLFQQPPSEPDFYLSIDPALQCLSVRLNLLGWLSVLDCHMAGVAQDQGFAPTSHHDLLPSWFFGASLLVQIAQCPDMVDFNIGR